MTVTEPNEPDTTAAQAMTDRIAAELFWRSQPTWNRDTRDEVEELAERLAEEGREPTEYELNLIRRNNGLNNEDVAELRDWLADRKAVEYFGHHGAGLVSQVTLVRATDILAAAAITAFACTVSTGVLDILRSVGTLIRHFA